MMLWVALLLPQLSLDIIQRSQEQATDIIQVHAGRRVPGQPTTQALAICDRLFVLSANSPARDGGIEPAMKRASALALMPQVLLIDHDPVREQQALTALACWALQFTPSTGFGPPPVSLRKAAPPASNAPLPMPGQAGLLLEVQPSLKYFGGLPPLLQHIHSGLQRLGYHARTGIAPTPGAAWLLAMSGAQCNPDDKAIHSMSQLQQRLAPLPLTLLSSTRQASTELSAMGAITIGDLLDLPRAGLARRFGKNLLIEVDSALGLQAQPIGFFQAPQQFSSKLELLADVEQADALLFAARRLLVELTGWLSARQAAVRSFDLIVQHEEAPVTALTVRLNDPSRDLERLTGLLRERLNVLQLRAPVHTIELRCERIQTFATHNDELFANAASTHESLGRLLERLQIRLGREQVQRLYLAQDHRPEAAYQIRMVDSLEQLGKPAITPTPTAAAATKPLTTQAMVVADVAALPNDVFATNTGSLPRPLWLLRDPQPLRERNNRPWLHSALNIMAGPERIETGWWDNALVQRDYFVAEDDTHTLYWIYRERKAHPGNGWYVHGRFG